VLSKRCLFFTNDQIFFDCNEYFRAESIVQYPAHIEDSSRDTLSSNLLVIGVGPSHQWDTSASYVRNHLREYTRRSLSCETDGLDDFRGLLGRFFTSYWGIPIDLYESIPSDGLIDYEFVKSLFWWCGGVSCGNTAVTRRSMLPSWC
jgi:hypothetical protein